MTVVDARNGVVVRVGDTVRYYDHSWQLLEVRDLGVRGAARVRVFPSRTESQYQFKTRVEWVPLIVRFMHPKYPFRRVGFFPS